MKITKKIVLEPAALSDIKTNLLIKIKSDFKDKCTKDYGFILEIYDSIKILSNTIIDNGSVLFEVIFNADVLKPDQGQIMSGKVIIVIDSGFIISVKDRMKIFVPRDQCGEYKYNKSNSCYENGTKKIKNTDAIKVKIYCIKYEQQKYECLGSLV